MKKTAISILVILTVSVSAFADYRAYWGAYTPSGFYLQEGTIQAGGPQHGSTMPRYYNQWANRLTITGTNTKFTKHRVGDILATHGSTHFAGENSNWFEMEITSIESDTRLTVARSVMYPYRCRWFWIKPVGKIAKPAPIKSKVATEVKKKIYEGVSVSDIDKAIGIAGVKTGEAESPKGKTDFYRWTLTVDAVLKATFRDGGLVAWDWLGVEHRGDV